MDGRCLVDDLLYLSEPPQCNSAASSSSWGVCVKPEQTPGAKFRDVLSQYCNHSIVNRDLVSPGDDRPDFGVDADRLVDHAPVFQLWADSVYRSGVRQVHTYLTDAVEHLLLIGLLYVVLCVALYLAIVRWRLLSIRRDVGGPVRRVLFVTAHPDDECMFFGPTIINFTRHRRPKADVFLLCLSSGKNYGMDTVRKRELYASCAVLGIPPENVSVHNHTLMPDAMTERWPAELVMQRVLSTVESFDIDTVITFDKHGVSRHLNHCSIYFAVAQLILEQRFPKGCRVFVLETVNLLRKYWYTFDVPFSFILSRYRYILQAPDLRLTYHAMCQHKSQLAWFRRLYVIFSRYMVLNTLQEMKLSDIQLEMDIGD